MLDQNVPPGAQLEVTTEVHFHEEFGNEQQ